MKGTARRVYLGIGALATGAYYLLPYNPAGAVLNVVVGASAVAAIAAGLRWHRPVRRLPWGLIAAAQGLFVAGDALFSINDLVLGIEPFPSLADALYLPGHPVLAAGLALLALSSSTGRDWAGLIDAAIIAIGFGLLSWVLVMVPYFQDPSLGMVELLVSLAYPVAVSRRPPPTPCTWSPTCCWARPGCTRRWPGCRSRPGGARPAWAGAGCSPWGRPPWSPRPC
jgi:hypothetical protein